jgi:hypothetical protein
MKLVLVKTGSENLSFFIIASLSSYSVIASSRRERSNLYLQPATFVFFLVFLRLVDRVTEKPVENSYA